MRLILAMIAIGLLSGCLSWHQGALPGEPTHLTTLQIGDTRVHYVERGRGSAVVLLHGFGSASHVWTPLMDRLASDHRLIAIDLKGFGWTDRPPGDYSPRAQAELVFGVLDALGVNETAVVGHSWGSSVALEMALQQPDRIERLALYAAWVYEEQLPAAMHWSRATGMGEVLYGIWYGERMEDQLALAFYDPTWITQDMVDAVEARMKQPGTRAAALAATRGQRFARVQRRYSEIAQPTLLLWGREDAISRLAFGERLARELPQARLVTYAGCGHLPMIEAARASEAEVASFLAEGRRHSWWQRLRGLNTGRNGRGSTGGSPGGSP